MNKYLSFVIIICGLLFVVLINLESRKEVIDNHQKLKADPKKVVEFYIDSAIKGNEEVVKTLVTGVPDSYSTKCISNNEIVDSNLEGNIIVPKTSQTNDSLVYSDEKFVNLSNSDSEYSLAFPEARYIYTTNNIFKKINISNAEIYNDEASVVVEYIISDTSKSKSKFLLKKDVEWKIFTTESMYSSSQTINENYAKARPKCE